MPATSACPLCGGTLPNEGLRFHRNILISDSGAVALAPTEETIARALLRAPGGLTTLEVAHCAGILPRYVWALGVNRLGVKLQDIGWAVKNIGCGGRGGALYVIQRKWQ